MMSHMLQMMQRLNKMLKGETENFDNVGNTVESAIQAKKQALYDLEYPLALVYRSIEAEQTPHQRKVVSSSIFGEIIGRHISNKPQPNRAGVSADNQM